MEKFFKKYPNAKPIHQVGERAFLSHAEKQAQVYAQLKGQKVTQLKQQVKKTDTKPKK